MIDFLSSLKAIDILCLFATVMACCMWLYMKYLKHSQRTKTVQITEPSQDEVAPTVFTVLKATHSRRSMRR